MTQSETVQALRRVSLFPPDVVVTWAAAEEGGHSPLLPEEAALLAQAVPTRRDEFALGRHCAREALRRLDGEVPAPLLRRGERMPQWPPGRVGAISHSHGLAVAAVGDARGYVGLGVDVERLRPVSPRLRERVLRPEEREALAGLSDEACTQRTILTFSLKECIYKALFPVTGVYLGYQDARVEADPPGADGEAGRLRWALCAPAGADFPAGWRGEGAYAWVGAVVVTAVWVPRGASQEADGTSHTGNE